MQLSDDKSIDLALIKLNAIRIMVVLMIAFGYASTMPIGPGNPEKLVHLGYDPSWIGISLLFFFSGFLGLRSLRRHGSAIKYLESRFFRIIPMLTFVTLLIALILFPLFGASADSLLQIFKTVGLYVIGTISCLRPGEQLPGLLDDSKYMCLIQGAIWTLKWGLIAHILAAIGQKLHIFKNGYIIASLALGSIVTYFALVFASVNMGVTINENILLAARLGWPFLAGMCVFGFYDKFFASSAKNLMAAAILFLAAWIWYKFLPWTGAIEILLTLGWMGLFLALLASKPEQFSLLNNMPPLALALYLIHWPAAQILLLLMPETGSWGLIAWTLPTSLFLAFCAHILISKPSNKFASYRLQKKSVALA